MNYVSTRGDAPSVSFSEAILAGLAPDGGLYVPARYPEIDPESIDPAAPFHEQAARFLEPFLAGDPLAGELRGICRSAFDFPLPLTELDETTTLLELFWGPTAAFKDFGARFLAECFDRLAARRPSDGPPLRVLVATSGDTGGAVAAAFHGKRNVEVGVLFPLGGVSPRQQRQLTCWGGNVHSFAVRGTFDDCQRLVKQAFTESDSGDLTSANSINVGRLLPQAAYHAASAIRARAILGAGPGVVVPSGNLGNAVGAFWARRVGFPIEEIALACNANRTVPDWFDEGVWKPRPSVATLANAMDVGDPSNMERLFHLFPQRSEFLAGATSLSVDDATIRKTIAAGPERYDRVFCPHTATAVHHREQLASGHWVVVATAHPAKFESIVEPLIGREIDLPESLSSILVRKEQFEEIDADLSDLRRYLDV